MKKIRAPLSSAIRFVRVCKSAFSPTLPRPGDEEVEFQQGEERSFCLTLSEMHVVFDIELVGCIPCEVAFLKN